MLFRSATPAFVKQRAAEGQGQWRVGQSLTHTKFGAGVIITAEGSGEDLRLLINFAEHGVKLLDLRYAADKLTPA